MKNNHTNIPSLKLLQVFESTVRTGSISASSDELCVTKSVISVQIKSLESFLNVNLFKKSGRKNILTSEGENFYLLAKSFLNEWESKFLLFKDDCEITELSVQTYVISAIKWLGLKLLDFKENAYLKELNLNIITTEHMKYQSNSADIGFVLEREPSKIDTEFVWNKVFPHSITPFCSTEFLESCGGSINIEQIESIPTICCYSDIQDWNDWFEKFAPNKKFHPHMLLGDKAMALELALNNKGLILINSVFIQKELSNRTLCKPFEHWLHNGEWGFIYKKGDKKEKLLLELIKHICG